MNKDKGNVGYGPGYGLIPVYRRKAPRLEPFACLKLLLLSSLISQRSRYFAEP